MNIPIAEDFLKDLLFEYEETGEYKMYFAIDIPNKLREFAKLHCIEQAKIISEKAKTKEFYYRKDEDYEKYEEFKDIGFIRDDRYGESYAVDVVEIDKDSILNAYNLDNIK